MYIYTPLCWLGKKLPSALQRQMTQNVLSQSEIFVIII